MLFPLCQNTPDAQWKASFFHIESVRSVLTDLKLFVLVGHQSEKGSPWYCQCAGADQNDICQVETSYYFIYHFAWEQKGWALMLGVRDVSAVLTTVPYQPYPESCSILLIHTAPSPSVPSFQLLNVKWWWFLDFSAYDPIFWICWLWPFVLNGAARMMFIKIGWTVAH